MNTAEFPDLPQRLTQRLAGPLPDRSSRERFAPELCYGRHFGPIGPASRAAAVAILLHRMGQQWAIPLTLRPDHLSAHAGQVSLPGGSVERDETVEQAAIRELYEELGVSPSGVTVIGKLSPLFVFVSDFIVTPVVLTVGERPNWRLDPAEVAEIIELPLVDLTNPANYGNHMLRPHLAERECEANLFIEFQVPYIGCGRHLVWGATAVILGELMAVLEELKSSRT